MTRGSAQSATPRMAVPDIELERRAGGALLLRSREPLGPVTRSLGDMLHHWARADPARVHIAERARDGGGWRRVTYAQSWDASRRIGQWLVDRGLGQERPMVILSGNSVDHALLMLGGLVAGVPVAPVSVAYSLVSTDHERLRHVVGVVRPGLVFAEDGDAFAPAVAALDLDDDTWLVTSRGRAAHPRSATLDEILATPALDGIDTAFAAITPDTVAKILFTSGSTGHPKGVVNTHRMLCSNQQAITQIWPFIADSPPLLLDWLPWNHTFGGNHNFNLVLNAGGTLHIDAGRPLPEAIATTAANLREVSPTIYFNVPAGYAALLPLLEADDDLALCFLRDLALVFYAGASMPDPLWARMVALSERIVGRAVMLTSSWGTTETGPLATAAHYPVAHAGVIGVPVPGVTLKLVPNAGKLEIRVLGPSITPGYHGHPELNAAMFDEEGFYRPGDAVRLVDDSDPDRGLVFDGRIAEDFKLLTGTWVSVADVRVGIVSAAAPLVRDCVVTGADRDEVGVLVWLDEQVAMGIASGPGDAVALARDPGVHGALARALAAHNAGQRGSSTRVARALILTEPPVADANEITDKGYVNQRAVLRRRADLVDRLHGEGGADVVVATAGAEAGRSPR